MKRTLLAAALLVAALPVGCGSPVDPPATEAMDFAIRQSVCFGVALDVEGALELGAGAYAPSPVERARRDCTLAASDCEGVLACFGLTERGACAPGAAATCEGEVLVRCDPAAGGRLRAYDCAEDPFGNTSCMVGSDGSARCASATCSGASLSCDGSDLSACEGDLAVARPCSAGTMCVEMSDVGAGCSSRRTRCFQDLCDGDDVFARCPDGYRTDLVLTCSLYVEGASCGEDAMGTLGCVVPEPECIDGEAMCAGAVARVCVAGVWQEIDCRAFLGAGCREDGGVRCAR